MSAYDIEVHQTAHGPECPPCRENVLAGTRIAWEAIVSEGKESSGYRGGGEHFVRLRVYVRNW